MAKVNNALLDLAKKLEKLPEEVKNALLSATKKAIDEAAWKMRTNFKRNSGNPELNSRLKETKIDTEYTYGYEFDWDNKDIVDEALGINWGRYKGKKRASGKRNYSIAPATWHDLAYIIDEGAVIPYSPQGAYVIAGNNFIKKARRNIKGWRQKRDKYAVVELDIVANNLDKE